jgi:hypothetical protein
MSLGVGASLGHDGVAPALLETGLVDGLIDPSFSKVDLRIDEDLGDRRAVPAAFDQQHSAVLSLDAELVDLVVEHWLISEGTGRELEVLGLLIGVGAVRRQQPRRVPSVAHTLERGDGLPPRFMSRPVERSHTHEEARDAGEVAGGLRNGPLGRGVVWRSVPRMLVLVLDRAR